MVLAARGATRRRRARRWPLSAELTVSSLCLRPSQGVRRGVGQDLVQGFFARLLEKGDLASVDREKGVRSFLMASCAHFLANQSDAIGWKRGADGTSLDRRPHAEAATGASRCTS